jgi:shikimate kinase
VGKHIAIAGFMGVGKTTVGRQLAMSLSLPFLDLDAEIERRSGRSCSQWFVDPGEDAFRVAETEVLASVLSGSQVVLALGGGTLHHGDNLSFAHAHAHVVWLDLPLAEIRTRLGEQDEDRPLWKDASSLFEARRPVFERINMRIDCSERTTAQLVSDIMESMP